MGLFFLSDFLDRASGLPIKWENTAKNFIC